jgi:DNA-binding transcriptional MerR regulator
VSSRRLRSWSDGGIIPNPERVVCGCRAYRRYDYTLINIIKEIKSLLDKGYTLRAASEMVRADVKEKGGNV